MRICITGSTGRLGKDLISFLSNDKHISIVELKHKDVSICNFTFVDNFFKNDHNFDLIVHLAAFTSVDKAEIDKASCYNTNVIGTKNILDVISKYNIHFLFMSTDYVFDGEKGNYKEDDIPNPINYYGLTKLLGETLVSSYKFKNIIVRTSFKPDKWQHPCAFYDVYTSADYISVISKEVGFLIKNFYHALRSEENIYHIGTDKKTMYELAKLKNYDIKKISKNEVNFKVPNDLSFDTSKWEEFKCALS